MYYVSRKLTLDPHLWVHVSGDWYCVSWNNQKPRECFALFVDELPRVLDCIDLSPGNWILVADTPEFPPLSVIALAKLKGLRNVSHF